MLLDQKMPGLDGLQTLKRLKEPPTSLIETLTLNGFHISRIERPTGREGQHVFRVRHFPDGADATVTVDISPEALGRVERLTKRRLSPQGAFWRAQAERRLSAHVWTEGSTPRGGRLTVEDVTREDIEISAALTSD